MQQLSITLIVLLGMIVPVANRRLTKLFMRIVPPMSVSLRHQSSQLQQPHPSWRSESRHLMIALASQQRLFSGLNDISRFNLAHR